MPALYFSSFANRPPGLESGCGALCKAVERLQVQTEKAGQETCPFSTIMTGREYMAYNITFLELSACPAAFWPAVVN